MTDLRTADQRALQALDAFWQHGVWGDFRGVADNLRAALAEPVQEPVAWMDPHSGEVCRAHWLESHAPERDVDRFSCPLYTAPPQRKPEPVQEPACATRECMPSECPNCVSLQDQNTELDRKLAELEAALRAQS